MNDSIWQKLLGKLKKIEDPHVKVGILSNEKHDEKSDFGIAELGAVHEYGAPSINLPERSFLRKTFNEKQDELSQFTANLVQQIIEKEDMTAEKALEILGQWGVLQVKNTISERRVTPPLSEATIKAKGSDIPLVDEGILLNSITYKVEKR